MHLYCDKYNEMTTFTSDHITGSNYSSMESCPQSKIQNEVSLLVLVHGFISLHSDMVIFVPSNPLLVQSGNTLFSHFLMLR